MIAQHLPQRRVQQVRCGVIERGRLAAHAIAVALGKSAHGSIKVAFRPGE